MDMEWMDAPIVVFFATGQTRGQAISEGRRLSEGVADCDWIDLRARRTWMVWDPVSAEQEWMAATGSAPAAHYDDFWDETGIYCPWRVVGKGDHPDARRVWVVFEKGNGPWGWR
jgi:hypothetical protein